MEVTENRGRGAWIARVPGRRVRSPANRPEVPVINFLLAVLLGSSLATCIVCWRVRDDFLALSAGWGLLSVAVTSLFTLFVLTAVP